LDEVFSVPARESNGLELVGLPVLEPGPGPDCLINPDTPDAMMDAATAATR